MSYCLNPSCPEPSNPENANQESCQSCGCPLLLNGRYRGIRELGKGGFATTYEVYDNNKSKALKVLKENYALNVALFQREAKVIKELKHEGIPKLEKDDYYFTYQADIYTLHCLVMEKIEGVNLEQWLEQQDNKPITEEQAIAWLSELMEILEELHQKQFFHRDIKPRNIMLRSNKLVLIDFGAVKKVTDTYLAKIARTGQDTRIFEAVYAAPEQIQGRSLPQSDFYSVGVTFVHLLTGKSPEKLQQDEYLKLLWRDSAAKISEPFANLIDWLIEPLPGRRPPHTKVIREYLEALKTGKIAQLAKIKDSPHKLQNKQAALFGSVAVTALVMGVRLTGILQSWELGVFDEMMRSRPPEAIDPRILVVEISEKETNPDKYGYPLKDGTLAELIEKIEQYQPQAIGLDIHRRQAQPPGREQFIKRFQQNQNLFTVCAFGNSVENYAPPGEFSQQQLLNQVGFSDLEQDNWIDNSVRRQLLSYDPKFSKSSACITPYSFSFLLAEQFLYAKGQQLEVNKKNEWYSGKAIFKRLAARTGGYQRSSGTSNEILINYRSKPKSSFCKPAEAPNNCEPIQRVSVSQVLANQVDPELIKNKIIFIGYTTPFISDEFNTPLGKMPGVLIHAHMTSQMLSAVIDGRPLLWVLPQWGDAIFVWGCAVVGCAIAWGCLQLRWKLVWVAGFTLVVSGITTLVLYVAGVGILAYGGWMPFVPSVLSLFATVAWVFYSISRA